MMMPQKKTFSYAIFFLAAAIQLCCSLSSCCGYHFGQQIGLSSTYRTISVPYIQGDLDGCLTRAVVKELTRSGVFEYRPTGGALLLKVKLTDFRDENMGFRYDRKKSGELRHSIIPTETRRTVFVEMAVENSASNSIVLGPVRLSAGIDFDHDYESARDEVNVFSLGQLSDIDAALDAVETPLYQAMARKIVDYVVSSW